MDARAIGLAVVELGGGRQQKGDAIDHSVGVVLACKVGEQVQAGDTLCTIHAADAAAARIAAGRILDAYSFSDMPSFATDKEGKGTNGEEFRSECVSVLGGPEMPIVLERITS